MKADIPHILLVNPWIHDFAAYDFWAKPMGLLTIASQLRHHGLSVSYIDCLNRFHSLAARTDPFTRYGRGPFLKTRIPKPPILEDIPRNYSRYGIQPQWLRADLAALPRPDLIFVTSLMTYWYTGVQETIIALREVFPDTPVWLGGIYASLCEAHARRHSGADRIYTGPAEKQVLSLINEFTGSDVRPLFDPNDLDAYPYPALDLQNTISYVPLLTSRGCPFNCSYCASHFLEPGRMLRSTESVVTEIRYWNLKHRATDFILYDDAFLVDAESHAIPLLEAILSADLKVRFHTPNAVHVRGISHQTAGLMLRAGFKTLRLGLETADFEGRHKIDKKVTQTEFNQAAKCLKTAGFKKQQVGAYLLAGLPDQSRESIRQSIDIVKENNITPILAYYTPIPHTALWPRAKAVSRYDLESDPLLTNNAILPCQSEPFSWAKISQLKEWAGT